MTSAAERASAGAGMRQPASPRQAADRVVDQHTIRFTLPDRMGTVTLPEPQHLAFYGGLTAMAVLGFLDWPVAVVLGVGHLLAADQHHRILREFGDALEEA